MNLMRARLGRSWVAAAAIALATTLTAGTASAQNVVIQSPFAVETFATLPPEADFPEGITANPANGDIFVGTFDVKPDGSGSNFILRYDRRGRLRAQLPIGLVPVTGLAFNPNDGKVYFARPGSLFGLAALVQRIPQDFDASTPIEDVVTIDNIGPPPMRTEITLDGQPVVSAFPDSIQAPNGLAFADMNGTSVLLVTDSLQGALFFFANPESAGSTCSSGGTCPELIQLTQVTEFATAGFPLLGINGVAVLPGQDGDSLPRVFVTNTGDDRLLTVGGADFSVATPLAESLQGADGIVPGPGNTLIVSRALADSIAIVDADSGRLLAELGAFRGIRRDGSPRGLLFPGSIVRVGNNLFASNLALPQTGTAAEPELDVTTYTISRIRLPRVLPRFDR